MTAKSGRVTMLHGAGGTVMHDLVKNYIVRYFGVTGNAEVPLEAMDKFAEKSKVGILIYEGKVPIKESVRIACEMLGLDPFEVGNEGKVIMGVVKEKANDVLNLLRTTSEGKDTEIIGETTEEFRGVAMRTIVGGKRIVARPVGDPVPRIC